MELDGPRIEITKFIWRYFHTAAGHSPKVFSLRGNRADWPCIILAGQTVKDPSDQHAARFNTAIQQYRRIYSHGGTVSTDGLMRFDILDFDQQESSPMTGSSQRQKKPYYY